MREGMPARREKGRVKQLPCGHVDVRQHAQQVTVCDGALGLQPLGKSSVDGEGVRCELHEHIHWDRQHANTTLRAAAAAAASASSAAPIANALA